MRNEPHDENDKTGERGPAARDGIVDQQDAVLHEMAHAEASADGGVNAEPSADGAVNDTERRYGEGESPA